MASRTILDNKLATYCEVCRRDTGTTVCAVCAKCSARIIKDRRFRFSRSDGDVYMRKVFGRALRNSLHDRHAVDPRPVSKEVSVRVGSAEGNA